MPASEILQQYVVDLKFRTNAAEGKQAQETIKNIDTFSASAQKSLDNLVKSIGGLVKGLKVLSDQNKEIARDQRVLREESQKSAKENTDARKQEIDERRKLRDAQQQEIRDRRAASEAERKLRQQEIRDRRAVSDAAAAARQQEIQERRAASDAERTARQEEARERVKEREEKRKLSAEQRAWKDAEAGQLREFRAYSKSQNAETSAAKAKEREITQAAAKEKSRLDRVEREEKRKAKAEQDAQNRSLAETTRRQSEVKVAFAAMAVAGVAAATAIWQSLRKTGVEYEDLKTISNTYGASVRELIVLGKAFEIANLDKLKGTFESFASGIQGNTGLRNYIADISRQFTGMAAEVFNNLKPMQQYMQTLETMRKIEEKYIAQGWEASAARDMALRFGEKANIPRAAGEQYLATGAPEALKKALQDAEKSTDQYVKETAEALANFSEAMNKLNQTLKGAVDKQKGYAADFFTPWIEGFNEFLRLHPKVAAAAGVLGEFGSFAGSFGKELFTAATTVLILRRLSQLRTAITASSTAAGAEAGAALGTSYMAAFASTLTKLAAGGVIATAVAAVLRVIEGLVDDAYARIFGEAGIKKQAEMALIEEKQKSERGIPRAVLAAPSDVIGWATGLNEPPKQAIEYIQQHPEMPGAQEYFERNPDKAPAGWKPPEKKPEPPKAQAPATPPVHTGPLGPKAPVSEDTQKMLRERDGEEKRPGAALGGIVTIDAHEGEMVLPRNISEGLQRLTSAQWQKNDPTHADWGFGGRGAISDRGGETTRVLEEINNVINDLLDRFNQWWGGSSAFSPFVKFAQTAGENAGGAGQGGGAGAGGAGQAVGAGVGGESADLTSGVGGAAGPGGGDADLAAGGGEGKGGAVPELSGKGSGAELANQAISYFMKQGWTKEQAAGIAANIEKESSWNATAKGDGGKAFGLAQWHPDRQANFKKQFGKPIQEASFGEQLAFIDWELKNTEKSAGDRLRGTTSAREAGAAVSGYYERPKDRAGEMSARGSGAERLSRAYQEPAAFGMRGGDHAHGAAPPVPGGGGQTVTGGKERGVNPELHGAMDAAFKTVLPKGYTARLTSGKREGDSGQHGHGSAQDWKIYDDKGNEVRNRGPDVTGYYRKAAVEGLARLMVTNPELAEKFAWGGHFGVEKGGGGELDIMHYDLGTPRGRHGDPMGERKEAAERAKQLRDEANKPVQTAQNIPPVPQFELGGLIPRMLQGVLPAILHPGEMILPRGLSDGLQGLIGALGGRSQGMNPLGMLGGGMGGMLGGMAGNMMGMFNRPLGGDFRNISYDQRADNSRSSNVNLTQVNNMNLGGFTGDSSGDLPRRMAAVHRRSAGDLVRNFQLAVR